MRIRRQKSLVRFVFNQELDTKRARNTKLNCGLRLTWRLANMCVCVYPSTRARLFAFPLVRLVIGTISGGLEAGSGMQGVCTHGGAQKLLWLVLFLPVTLKLNIVHSGTVLLSEAVKNLNVTEKRREQERESSSFLFSCSQIQCNHVIDKRKKFDLASLTPPRISPQDRLLSVLLYPPLSSSVSTVHHLDSFECKCTRLE